MITFAIFFIGGSLLALFIIYVIVGLFEIIEGIFDMFF